MNHSSLKHHHHHLINMDGKNTHQVTYTCVPKYLSSVPVSSGSSLSFSSNISCHVLLGSYGRNHSNVSRVAMVTTNQVIYEVVFVV